MRTLTLTQRFHLRAFVAEYLSDLCRQLKAHDAASQSYSIAYSIPLATRNALIKSGFIEIVSARESTATIRKGYAFGRVYRTQTIPVAHVNLAPTRAGIEWYLFR